MLRVERPPAIEVRRVFKPEREREVAALLVLLGLSPCVGQQVAEPQVGARGREEAGEGRP